ncbi:MAG: preprotein translocase subunit SecA [Anaerolineae bacterium]|nr:preprotein translocase subunit SecA [Anaerolineae bacterium]NUQ04457.1 preprotein translocase subunit SecA [Anaerolineae bacterium]
MFKNLVTSVFGDPTARALKGYREVVERINQFESALKKLTDADLRAKTDAFRKRLAGGETLDDLLPEAFAVVREASTRTIGLRHYDVQMIGGIVLHEGRIAEMKTGEGKTLVATLPLYLNALAGKGAHLVTPNDYLSKVGVQQMGPVYYFLGMSIGVIQNMGNDPTTGSYLFDPNYPSDDARLQNLRPVSRRDAYQADITYGTNNEFGFDYLRDNMVGDLPQMVQRDLNFAIVDEVDNILIDEARTPLIISGQADEPSDLYRRFAQIVRTLKASSQESVEDDEQEPDGDYVIDIKDRVVYLTDAGTERVERALGVEGLYTPEHADMVPYLDNSLRAHALYHLDKEYIVQEGQVIIVDEFTGRLMYGRRFSEGLHQAIEAKEGVEIRRENLTMATITFQNFFRMYRKLAGMTGTAATESEEFEKIYNLEVVSIPTHRPMVRKDHDDLIYANEGAKFSAVIDEIRGRQERGQPVLVGTVAIETSERLSKALKKAGIRHEVLNAKQHEREADIIAQAGRLGMVTIATNMAGRGVDILLGGNPEGLARERLRRDGKDVTQVPPEEFKAMVGDIAREIDPDRRKVIEMGGLFVLGTERHEARRIDNQLRGRSGRQGDPGESRFYLSLEDDLIKRFGGDRVKSVMQWAKIPENEPIEHPIISRSIGQAQMRVEGYNFDIRKRVLEYDDVVNKQREVIYRQRREVLNNSSLRDEFLDILNAAAVGVIGEFGSEGAALEEWDMAALLRQLYTVFPVPAHITAETLENADSLEALEDIIGDGLEEAYDRKTTELSEDLMRRIERVVMLSAIDFYWRRHLTDLDVLREGIGLVAMAQRDPVVEYKREAFQMWEALQDEIRTRAARDIFRVQVGVPAQAQRVMQRVVPQNVQATREGAAADSKPEPVRKSGVKANIGRNDPCWCGSGKKYKHCHYKQDQRGVTE